MITIISNVIGAVVTFPFITTVLLYFIAIKMFKNKWRAIHFAVNYTTILYIFAVGIILHTIFGDHYLGIIVIFILLFLSIAIVIQWKRSGEVIFRKVFKVYWRFLFIVFFIGSFVLMIVGLSVSIMGV
ncbi:DUF3397 domain-containing protein [Aquibacillus koreensis]|uniref:DUF3397 domain-containing protein n=1 Tax=Aquibacillus koreensis TaxID=279446 RepID=A0A9X4AHY8_9BACI|nr:DUF3397 domain-containing protein [Aquibacillus koreensis]MCT2538069.1 DUF3397 domain-containing protein [Aquibacillus koreensis]MDC3420592.1 DUF3397 domain-containing protein [Aquibacillus koreensis]